MADLNKYAEQAQQAAEEQLSEQTERQGGGDEDSAASVTQSVSETEGDSSDESGSDDEDSDESSSEDDDSDEDEDSNSDNYRKILIEARNERSTRTVFRKLPTDIISTRTPRDRSPPNCEDELSSGRGSPGSGEELTTANSDDELSSAKDATSANKISADEVLLTAREHLDVKMVVKSTSGNLIIQSTEGSIIIHSMGGNVIIQTIEDLSTAREKSYEDLNRQPSQQLLKEHVSVVPTVTDQQRPNNPTDGDDNVRTAKELPPKENVGVVQTVTVQQRPSNSTDDGNNDDDVRTAQEVPSEENLLSNNRHTDHNPK